MRLLKILLPAALLLSITSCDQDPDYDPVAQQSNNAAIDRVALLSAVNNYRSSGCNCGGQFYPAVPALTWNDTLQAAASTHALDMNDRNELSHTGSNGSTVDQRVSSRGYNWSAVGENIAQGPVSEQAVIDAWIGSTEHCQNIMNANFTQMGVGRSGEFWAQVLAKPQ